MISSDSDTGRIYELRARIDTALKTRRMSIRQLGESVESKSACYMVTYDDFLVIKIPPAPITDFKRYIDCIETEKTISEQLSPSVRTLSPSLSVILGRIPAVTGNIPKKEEIREEDYIRLLEQEPRFQDYLKIGHRFAFFMDLSQDAFLDQAIERIHNEKGRMIDEIINTGNLFDDLVSFEAVYGGRNNDLFFRMNDLYKAFGLNIDAFLKPYNDIPSIQDFQKREWLFALLAEKQPEINTTELPAEFDKTLLKLFSRVVEAHKATVESYRSTVRASVRKKIFDNNRKNIETLIIKTLELIYCLKERKVAARDLKPENILVAANVKGATHQIADPDAYALGLIDLETAVNFGEMDIKRVKQPMLAGTPAYMTPSHLFDNHVLNEIFKKEMPRILYLQDWFAAIGIIFCIVTGRRLFEKTAKLIPEIIRVQKKAVSNNVSLPDILLNVSRIFWRSAGDEFYEMTGTGKQRLQSLRLSLPEHIVDIFSTELRLEKKMIAGLIKECAESQKLFPGKSGKLIDAPYEAIREQRMKWEENGEKHIPPDVRSRVIELFSRLENYKHQLMINAQEDFSMSSSISCGDLLIFLFRRVACAMGGFIPGPYL